MKKIITILLVSFMTFTTTSYADGIAVDFEVTNNDAVAVGVYDLDQTGLWGRLGMFNADAEDYLFGFGGLLNIGENFYGYAGPVFSVEDTFDGTLAIGVIYNFPTDKLILNLGYDDIAGTTFGFGGQF